MFHWDTNPNITRRIVPRHLRCGSDSPVTLRAREVREVNSSWTCKQKHISRTRNPVGRKKVKGKSYNTLLHCYTLLYNMYYVCTMYIEVQFRVVHLRISHLHYDLWRRCTAQVGYNVCDCVTWNFPPARDVISRGEMWACDGARILHVLQQFYPTFPVLLPIRLYYDSV